MSYIANISDPKKEKHTLIIIRPRIRLTGWESYSSGGGLETYRVSCPHGFVTRVWEEYSNNDGFVPSASLALVLLNNSSWFYDHDTKFLYFTDFAGLDPDDNDYPGLTAEFELNLSDQAFTGPRDPKNGNSISVNWIPCIKSAPLAQSGSRQDIYGFLPVNQSSIEILNSDGWMNEFIYSATFNLATCKAYILAGDDLNDGVTFSDVKQVFTGYTNGFRVRDFTVSITCADILSFFDKQVALRKTSSVIVPSLDPAANAGGNSWYYPKIYGKVVGHNPINISYNAVPSGTDNRTWVTHDADIAFDNSYQDDGTILQTVDSAAANSATVTFLTSTPLMMVGDGVKIQRGGVDKYATVTFVNTGLNSISHSSITGTAAPGDTVTRPFVARVTIKNAAGDTSDFLPYTDYSLYVDNTLNLRGFTLGASVESFMAGAPFDPASWEIYATVYGKKTPDVYLDSTDVGAVSPYGGIVAGAASIIYRLLADAGFSRSEISEELFQIADDDELSVGFSIPTTLTETTPPTYKSVISAILNSNIYKLYISEDSTGTKIGISEVAPFATSGDYNAGELNHSGLSFEHEYDQIYSSVSVSYARNKNPVQGDPFNAEYYYESAESESAKSLHFVSKSLDHASLLYAQAEAQTLVRRLAFILGDRRGYWSTRLELPYVDKTNLGASYKLTRQFMPGAVYTENTYRDQTLAVIEVNKSSNGVNITFEDQKGVQDNAADW